MLFTTNTTHASVSPLKTFHCEIKGFDEKFLFIDCKHPNNKVLLTPKEWVALNSRKIKTGDKVNFSLNETQINKWKSLNKKVISKNQKVEKKK